MWNTLFSFANGLALVGWVVLAFLPRKPVALSAVLYLGVAVLCLAYLVLVVFLFSGVIDPVRPEGVPAFDPLDMSIDSIRALFLSDGGIVIGWIHYLAFDLFVGLWIAKDADAKCFSRVIQLPYLLLTFLAGPIGLFFWLVTRERRARIGGERSGLRNR